MRPRREPIDGEILVKSGLAAMKEAGKPLTRMRGIGRSMIYAMPNGETVRIRTCNDQKVVIVGWTAAPDAKLNIEGTDWLLLVMPEVLRCLGKIVCYLVPTIEVVAEARRVREAWLPRKPDNESTNRTWKLWFRQKAYGNMNDLVIKWSKYRVRTSVVATEQSGRWGPQVKKKIEEARRRVALAAGVPIEAVDVKIKF